MSDVVHLRAYREPSAIPTLVLVDLQQEYVASQRGLSLAGADAAVDRCRAALAHSRAIGLPVAFVRWKGRSPFFNQATRFWHWIPGCEPRGSDMIFERDQPSCYASPQFTEVMTMGGGRIVLAGFAGEAACLATTIDGFHRGHHITFLSDASASHGLREISADDVHRTVIEVARVYGDVIETEAWIASTAPQSDRGRGGGWMKM